MKFYGFKFRWNIALSLFTATIIGLLVIVVIDQFTREKVPQFNTTEELIAEVKLLQSDVANLKAEQIEYEKRLANIYRAIVTRIALQAVLEITDEQKQTLVDEINKKERGN